MASCICHVLCVTKRLRLERIVRPRLADHAKHHGPRDCGATNPAPEPADCESLAHGERCSCANGEANQHERGYDAPDREASLFGLPLATQLSLDAQIRLKNGLRDCFGLLLFHVPAFLISGLTPSRPHIRGIARVFRCLSSAVKLPSP